MSELEKFTTLYGKIDYPSDLLTIPSEVLEYSDRLGLSASEFKFICWIFHLTNKDIGDIKDKYITNKKTNFARQRKSLMSKGYLKIKIATEYKNKCVIRTGLIYDFTLLKNKIEELKEEDRKLEELEAPVMVVYDEPSLFNEDIDLSSKYPNKILTDDKEIEELKLENEFLEKYNLIHKKILNYEIDYNSKASYKMHLLKIFKARINNNIDEALEIAAKNFLKLKHYKRDSLAFQDLVRIALTQDLSKIENNDKNQNDIGNKEKYLIPKGLDKLNYLLDKIEEGGDIDEVYSQLCV